MTPARCKNCGWTGDEDEVLNLCAIGSDKVFECCPKCRHPEVIEYPEPGSILGDMVELKGLVDSLKADLNSGRAFGINTKQGEPK